MSSEEPFPANSPLAPAGRESMPQQSHQHQEHYPQPDSATGPPTGEHDVLFARLRGQVEFYFSPHNLSRDKYLRNMLTSTHTDMPSLPPAPLMAPIGVITNFPKVRDICAKFGHSLPEAPHVLVARASEGSSIVTISSDGAWIGPASQQLPPMGITPPRGPPPQSHFQQGPFPPNMHQQRMMMPAPVHGDDVARQPMPYGGPPLRAESPSSNSMESLPSVMKECVFVAVMDLSPECNPMEVLDAFTTETVRPMSASFDFNNIWYVAFGSEADANSAILASSGKTISGTPVRAKLNSELPPSKAASVASVSGASLSSMSESNRPVPPQMPHQHVPMHGAVMGQPPLGYPVLQPSTSPQPLPVTVPPGGAPYPPGPHFAMPPMQVPPGQQFPPYYNPQQMHPYYMQQQGQQQVQPYPPPPPHPMGMRYIPPPPPRYPGPGGPMPYPYQGVQQYGMGDGHMHYHGHPPRQHGTGSGRGGAGGGGVATDAGHKKKSDQGNKKKKNNKNQKRDSSGSGTLGSDSEGGSQRRNKNNEYNGQRPNDDHSSYHYSSQGDNRGKGRKDQQRRSFGGSSPSSNRHQRNNNNRLSSSASSPSKGNNKEDYDGNKEIFSASDFPGLGGDGKSSVNQQGRSSFIGYADALLKKGGNKVEKYMEVSVTLGTDIDVDSITRQTEAMERDILSEFHDLSVIDGVGVQSEQKPHCGQPERDSSTSANDATSLPSTDGHRKHLPILPGPFPANDDVTGPLPSESRSKPVIAESGANIPPAPAAPHEMKESNLLPKPVQAVSGSQKPHGAWGTKRLFTDVSFFFMPI